MAYNAPITSRTRTSTSGSQRNSGRVARMTRSFGSRTRSPGTEKAIQVERASPRGSRSDIAGILGGERPRRRRFVRRAGRASNEVIEKSQRFFTGGDAVEKVQRAAAMRLDLAFEHRAHAEIVEERAHTRRGALEGQNDRKSLLALDEIVHLDLAGALRRRPDAEQVVVGLERLAELLAEACQLLAD